VAHWKRWGPYLSERAWGTVREDYSEDGSAWDYFPHDHARSRAYRWNEDGIAGISDRHQKICLALALWNEKDPILKERLFGLNANEGNHGEDVKECYFYLDNTPSHSYMRYLYKYPQSSFPYTMLVEENRRRSKDDPEYELLDTGVFDENRYFDVFVEYARKDVEDILIKITAINRGPEAAPLHILPTIWFRNTWSAGRDDSRPVLQKDEHKAALPSIMLRNTMYADRWLYFDGNPELLFTENETNMERLFGVRNAEMWVKDGINDYVVHNKIDAVNPSGTGTKASVQYTMSLDAGESVVIRMRFTPVRMRFSASEPVGNDFESVFEQRILEANEFYSTIIPKHLSDDAKNLMRQSFAGLLWTKQYYHYIVKQWLEGDPAYPPPPEKRKSGRNHDWIHLYNADVLSVPDKWEYPWYASWDLAFHCVPLALLDPDFAKEQLILLLREWYMHPNGALPAYEWALDDVNPPVHAWAALQVYRIEKKKSGTGDIVFLKRVFHKLLLNFTWWVNRKDAEGLNIFQGGFLGLDNIGIFDRSKPLPTGGYLEQSDGTSWMAMYTLNLLGIALELASQDDAYEDVASKFWEHFLYISNAMNHRGQDGIGLWDDKDGFFYDVLHLPDGQRKPIRVHSIVGLVPLFAVQILEPELLDKMPGFSRRLEWFIKNRPDLTSNIACMSTKGQEERRLLSIVTRSQLKKILSVMLDDSEFLSPFGVRALSRFHLTHPYTLQIGEIEHQVQYEPGESASNIFGGNSNWRGPVWFPLNYLLIESLKHFYAYYGDTFQIEFPHGSGNRMNLQEIAEELSRRLIQVFLQDENGCRPVNGTISCFQKDPYWKDLILFYEYFHGDNGAGLGASHQTGWTALVASLLNDIVKG
jgi:hypothetical protein